MSGSTASSYDGVVERTGEGGTIRFERHLAFPLRDVWDAITNPERLADWWLPFDADITVDLREGGDIVFAGRGDDAPTITCTILRVEAPMLLEHTHVDPGSWLRWELQAQGDGCVLRLSHFVADAGDAIGKCFVVGLHTSLARLEPCLAGEPIPWDWDFFHESQTHYASVGLAPPLDAD